MPENPVHPDIKVQPVSNIDASLKSIPAPSVAPDPAKKKPSTINIRLMTFFIIGAVILVGLTYFILNRELNKYLAEQKKEAEALVRSLITPTPKQESKAPANLNTAEASGSSIITVSAESASISAIVDTNSWKTYSNSAFGLELKYPSHLTVSENTIADQTLSINFKEAEGLTIYTLKKNFQPQWLGKLGKEEEITIAGDTKVKLTWWLLCDQTAGEQPADCAKSLSTDNYQTSILEATFAKDGTTWYIGSKIFIKGETEIEPEIANLQAIVSSIKFP